MKKTRKILASLLAVAMMGSIGSTVFASSYSSTTLGGKQMTGSCSVSSGSGSATTTFDAIAGITTTVRYDYNHKGDLSGYRQVTKTNSNSSTSVSVTALPQSGDTNVHSLRSAGTHSVSYNGGYQTLYTNT